MSQFPVEIDDSQGINDALNYLLSGPAGLGQNFEGFAAYQSAFIRPSVKQPWSLPATTELNPSIYLDFTVGNIQEFVNPGQEIVVSFVPQFTAPFEYGDILELAGVVAAGVDPNFYNDSYTVLSCTTTEVTLFTSGTYTWPGYVSGGTIGRNWLNAPLSQGLSTDCNAHINVLGPTDQAFITAQLNLSWQYNCTADNQYHVIVSIVRNRGYADPSQGPKGYLFVYDAVVSQKTFVKSVVTGTGTQDLEAIFTTVLDGPNLDFGYYWYILEVQFAVPGSMTVKEQVEPWEIAVSGTRFDQPDSLYSGLTPTTVTGTGSGLVVDVSIYDDLAIPNYQTAPSPNTILTVTAGGVNYIIGDQLTIPGTDLGGTSPANDMTLTINYPSAPFDITIGQATMGLRSLTAQVIKQ